jgi:hypothetical protein
VTGFMSMEKGICCLCCEEEEGEEIVVSYKTFKFADEVSNGKWQQNISINIFIEV